MIPIRDQDRVKGFPAMTYGLIALSFFAFFNETGQRVRALALTPYFISHHIQPPPPAPAPDALTLVTSMFLHNDWLHIGGNMLFLLIFGPDVEYLTGPFRFLGFYLACGVAAGLVQVAAFPNSHIPAIGASAAIAGVLGAYIAYFGRNRIETILPIGCFPLFLQLPAMVVIGFWFVEQVWYVQFEHASQGGVAYLEHISGFLVGLLLIALFRVRLPPRRADYR